MSGTGGSEGPLPYTVYSYDTFHLMGTAEKYLVGRFATCEEALAACRELVDEFLKARHGLGMTADELRAEYEGSGPEPFVESADASCAFAPRGYALGRIQELCGSRPGDPCG